MLVAGRKSRATGGESMRREIDRTTGSRLRRWLLWVLTLAVLSPTPAPACDSTCCLMLTRGGSGLLRRGGFLIDFSFRTTDMSAKLAGSDSTAQVVRPKVLLEEGRLIPGYHEDLRGTDSFLQMDAAYGLLASTTVFASIPLLSHRTYDIGHGGAQTAYDVRGIGDLVIGARQGLVRSPQHSLVASVGFKLRTGKSDTIDEYDSTILDPTLQSGTGSNGFIGTLTWSMVAPGKTELGLSASYQANTTNSYEYRFGNLAIAAATLSRPIGGFVPSLQLKLVDQARSIFVDAGVPSTGATTLYLNAGLRYRTPEGLALYTHVLVPVYRYVNDAQLAPRYSLLFGLSKAF